MGMRRSKLFFYYITINSLLLGLMFAHASIRQQAAFSALRAKQNLVATLGLSDLCLFTDARYTRHPSVADLHTPFQDYPMSFEHFPSGSILTLPRHLRPAVGSLENALD